MFFGAIQYLTVSEGYGTNRWVYHNKALVMLTAGSFIKSISVVVPGKVFAVFLKGLF